MRQDRPAAFTAALALAVAAGLSARSLSTQLTLPIVAPWIASQYWLDYRDGLVRRGLPGAMLRLASGGRPSGAVVTSVGVVLSVAAAAVLAVVCFRLARAAAPAWRLPVLGVLVLSPLTFGLLLRDVGRYDTIVVLVLGFFALAPRPCSWRQPALAAATAAVLLVLGGGAEEFAIAFLLPVAFLWFGSSGPRFAAVCAPAVALSLLSAATRPSADLVGDVLADANAERVGVSDVPNTNAVIVLRNGLREQVDYVFEHSRWQMVLSFAVCVVLFIGVAFVLHRLVTADRRVLVLAGCNGAVATVLSVIGVDYRRWWGLATIGLITGTLVLVGRSAAPSTRSVAPIVVASFMLLCAVTQEIPIESHWLPETLANYLT